MLDTREFYQQYLREIEPGFVANFLYEEIDASTYYVFLKEIQVYAGDSQFIASGNPGSARFRTDATNFREGYHDYQKLIEALFDAKVIPEIYKVKTDIGPKLSRDGVKQALKEIVTAVTPSDKTATTTGGSGATLSLDPVKGRYQLTKTDKADRYCLFPEPPLGGWATPPVSGSKHLTTAAAGLRCGATRAELKNWEDLQKECGPTTPYSTAAPLTRRHCERPSCSAPPSASAPASPDGSIIRR